MPIVRVCQGQPELAVRLVTPGCDGAQLIDWRQVRLVIAPPERQTCETPLSPQVFKGCWPGHDTEKWNDSFALPETQPLIIYPAFAVNEDGDIVFILDSQIWQRRGRYVGIIEFNNGEKITELDLDISSLQFIADRVSTRSTPCGA